MHQNMKKSVHFGAGNIGRGFIGPLLMDSGYHVIFADVNKVLIEELNDIEEYHVHVLTNSEEDDKVVSDFSGLLSSSSEIVKAIADPNVDMVTTSVGVGILPKIAPVVAKGIQARRKTGAGPLNVIACENMVGATAHLAEEVEKHLDAEDIEYVKEHVGFAGCSVDRIVPPFDAPDDEPLDVGVEGFYEWVVERKAFKGEEGQVKGMLLTDNLMAYVERKLFSLNTGHAITAYLGHLSGYTYIHESIEDPIILSIVREAMHESGAALIKKHNFFPEEHAAYIKKIEERFRNTNIKDDVNRVGREPLRKLKKSDRLVGPAWMAKEYGLKMDYLAKGIAAAMRYQNDEDEQAKELKKMIDEHGVEHAVTQLTEFPHGGVEHRKVVDAYHALNDITNKQRS